jgi:copper transport protein
VVSRRLIGLAFAVALLAAPAGASAHATLEGTQPERGATVSHEPAAVVFRYDQTVEGNFGAVRVFDTRGDRVDLGDAFHPGGTGSELGVHLKTGLPDGSYTATYRVVSADGHIVSGGFVFAIGKPGTAPGLTVAQLIGKNSTGKVTEVAFGAARAVQFGAIAVALGALTFLLLIWLPALRSVAGGSAPWRTASERFVERIRTLLLLSALVGAISALAGVDLEAAEAAGISGWSALRPHVMSEVLGTRFGTIWTAGAACWLALGLLTVALLRPTAARSPVLRPVPLGAGGLALPTRQTALVGGLIGAPLLALLLLPALSGHGSTQAPVGVMFSANTIHVAALSVWLGGLVALLAALPTATRQLDGSERTRLLAATVSRFSPFALGSVIVLLTTGLVQAYIEVRHLSLLTSTDFGTAVLIKFCLLICLIGLGAINRQRTLPRLRAIARDGGSPGLAGVILRRTLRSEVALIVVVLGVVGALASYAPAIVQYNGPVSGTTTAAGHQLQYTLDPARVGSNQLHLYFLDPKSGAQWNGAQQVTVSASLPSKGIGPLTNQAQKAGPGHYVVPGILLDLPGAWQLQVQVLIDKFDQSTVTLKVTVH